MRERAPTRSNTKPRVPSFKRRASLYFPLCPTTYVHTCSLRWQLPSPHQFLAGNETKPTHNSSPFTIMQCEHPPPPTFPPTSPCRKRIRLTSRPLPNVLHEIRHINQRRPRWQRDRHRWHRAPCAIWIPVSHLVSISFSFLSRRHFPPSPSSITQMLPLILPHPPTPRPQTLQARPKRKGADSRIRFTRHALAENRHLCELAVNLVRVALPVVE